MFGRLCRRFVAIQLFQEVSRFGNEVARANAVQGPTGGPILLGRDGVGTKHSAKHSSIQAFQNLSADAAKRDSSPGQALCFRSRPGNPRVKALALRCVSNNFLNGDHLPTPRNLKKGLGNQISRNFWFFELKSLPLISQSCTVSKTSG
jgi:hypothetical protein